MKQIIVNEFGGPEKLILHDVPMAFCRRWANCN